MRSLATIPRGRHAVAGEVRSGAVIVELAIVSIFLLSLFAGTYDFGQAWRTGLAANEAARTGARVGSAHGPERDADFYGALRASSGAGVERSARRGRAGRRLPVDTDNGRVAGACKTGSLGLPGHHRRRLPDQLGGDLTSATITTGCLTIASPASWCPTTRDNVSPRPSHYGVWIKLRHDYEFPLLGERHRCRPLRRDAARTEAD